MDLMRLKIKASLWQQILGVSITGIAASISSLKKNEAQCIGRRVYQSHLDDHYPI